jgi:hypothetical protein
LGGRALRFEQLEARQYLSASPWTAVDADSAINPDELSYFRASNFETYTLDAAQLLSSASAAGGLNSTDAAGPGGLGPLEIALPNPDGGVNWFTYVESSIMAPELAAEFPDIHTYRGQGITDPTATLAFDITPAGFHAQVLSPSGTYYIDPYYHLDDSLYAVYSAENSFDVPDFSECQDCDCGAADAVGDETTGVTETAAASLDDALGGWRPSVADSAGSGDPRTTLAAATALSGDSTPADNPPTLLTNTTSGSQLRTYRLAVAATGEYTAFQGGTVAAAQAAIVTAVNRVSGVYETELSIKLQLVANNSSLVYTNASTDPYTNSNPDSLLTQNQSNIDSVIGNANYDIGHVFSTGGGGLAVLGCVGITGVKAQGETGLAAPTGDAFYIDYVAHEMGHQFGGDHTFNGDSGSCSGANRNGPTAYEPGSGSTIMAYAGICGNDDLQLHSDPYFHSVSIDQIVTYVDSTIPSVGSRVSTGNAIPAVSAGGDFTIPAQTPFTLAASGSDANAGDVLTYDWEERDIGAQRDLFAADNGSSPLFRSWLPTTDPSRTFPRLSNLLSNTLAPGEMLPTLSRNMNFRATVRDNRAGGGATSSDDMIVHVVATGAAFAVTSPNTNVSWTVGSTQAMTWNVAGTTANGINTANVNIQMSTDGGNTFPIMLAANTPNDGSQSIVVPNISSTTSARIKVEAVGNIFFDISNVNFSITNPPNGIDLVGTGFSATPSNLLSSGGFVNASITVGNQGNTASPAFDVKFYLSDDATIDPNTDMLLTLDPAAVYFDPSEPSAYHVTGGIAALGSQSATVHVAVPGSDPFGTDNQYHIGMIVDADNNAAEADESNNRNRGDGVDRQSVTYSATFANSANVSVPTSGAATPYPSNIVVAGLAGTLADVNVSLFGYNHANPDDVDVLLVGPAGQKLILLSDAGGNSDVSGVNLVFDDAAANSVPNTTQISSGTFKPSNYGSGSDTFNSPAPASPYSSTLSVFNNTSPNGTWSLYVMDDASGSGGNFSGGWSLTFVLNNTPPTNPGNVTLAAMDEDTNPPLTAARLVSSIVANSGATDPDGNPLGIAVTSVDNSHGLWQYSANGGGSWQDLTSVSATAARLLAPTYYERFIPFVNYNSSIGASPTFGFKAWDQTSGTAGGTANTTTGTAFSSGTATATQSITAVNDAPSFTLSASSASANEDAGAVSVSGFATNIKPGPATAIDETGQGLVFLVAVNGVTGPLTFDSAPAVDATTGALTFTTAANSYGTATIDVVLQDNDSSTPPNVNLSPLQQFTIVVEPVNDEQVLATNAGITVVQGSSGAMTSAVLETTDIDDSPADLLYTISAGPSHGTILVSAAPATQFSQQQVDDGLVSYENDGTASISDSFDFAVDDGEGTTSSGTFNVTIRPNAGDYTQDFSVDAADYVTWRKAEGATGLVAFTGADGNGDTTVDEADYDVWREHFGEIAAASGASVEGGAGSAEGFRIADFGLRIADEGAVERVVPGSSVASATLAEPVAPEKKVQAGVSLGAMGQSGSSAQEQVRHALRLIATREALRDDALLAWLSSRDYGRAGRNGETDDVSDGQDCGADENPSDDALDMIFASVEGGV